MKPFGQECCEHEVEVMKDKYKEYYFDHVPFNNYSLEHSTYLIVGRRGSGKTSLSQYFSFHNQDILKNSQCIDVDEPKTYQEVLSKISQEVHTTNNEVAINKLVNIWEYAIWSLIIRRYRNEDSAIAAAAMAAAGMFEDNNSPARFVMSVLKKVASTFIGKDTAALVDDFEGLISQPVFKLAKEKVIKITYKKPVIVSIDTLEHYNVNDEPMMRATAALIECASRFNINYVAQGIHVKAFVSAEVFPFLIENVISNPLKHVRQPVHLHWRPKDLMRLLCWRLYLFVTHEKLDVYKNTNIQWDNFSDVYNYIWKAHFPESILNKNGKSEKTFPYVLRHTQMRPRQLIVLCNMIATMAKRENKFPKFSSEIIIKAIIETEKDLASEVINSYKSVYPNVGQIVNALAHQPIVFKGKLLDRIAHTTASQWPDNDYNPSRFKQLVTELGIVGQVRHIDDKTKIVKADFEYTMKDRLQIESNTDYVIHPMFMGKLNITNPDQFKVYPFPDGDSYKEVHT